MCFCSAAAVPADLFFLFFSFFWLAKASAAWDGETVRLLALANKDSEKRSFLSFFLTLYRIHLSFFRLTLKEIYFTHSQVAEDLNLYYSPCSDLLLY